MEGRLVRDSLHTCSPSVQGLDILVVAKGDVNLMICKLGLEGEVKSSVTCLNEGVKRVECVEEVWGYRDVETDVGTDVVRVAVVRGRFVGED